MTNTIMICGCNLGFKPVVGYHKCDCGRTWVVRNDGIVREIFEIRRCIVCGFVQADNEHSQVDMDHIKAVHTIHSKGYGYVELMYCICGYCLDDMPKPPSSNRGVK